ncbi:hypothetical protein LG71_01460 [Pluralibacter gergoviae]|uniref:hypothetical protein n=1 Tax=Pluralibacter gergoviae TaxID=61647 RepID=UPI0004F8710D|nr:hypothetical protein [Pluralibacter gergoviae]AIQ98653.1 hypothetical protein LG71_01460 [Pluralibacter gergoviae]
MKRGPTKGAAQNNLHLLVCVTMLLVIVTASLDGTTYLTRFRSAEFNYVTRRFHVTTGIEQP